MLIFSYVTTPSTEPLIIFGPIGCGKSVLSAKVEHFIHNWLPECCFILRYTRLTAISSSVISLIGSITEQIYYYTKLEPYNGPHVSISMIYEVFSSGFSIISFSLKFFFSHLIHRQSKAMLQLCESVLMTAIIIL